MDHLAAWHDGIVREPLPDPRRVAAWRGPELRALGWLLLRCGAVAAVCALPFSLALMNIGFAAMAVGAALCRPPVHRLPGFAMACATACWVLLAVLWARADGRFDGRFKVPSLCWLWLSLYFAQAALRDRTARAWAVRLLIVGTCLSAALALAQWAIGYGKQPPLRLDPDSGNRFHIASGLHGGHLTQGFVMACIAIALWMPVQALGVGRAWAWAGRVAAAGACVISGSRMGQLAALAGGSAAVAARGWRWALGGLLGAVVLGGGVVALLHATQPARTANLLKGEDGRWIIWRTTLPMIREHPLVGVGGREAYRGQYQRWWPEANPPDTFREFKERGAPHAHNAPLSLAAMYGLPAALLYYGWLAVVVAGAWRLRGGARWAWCAVAGLGVAALAGGQFEDIAQDAESAYALWLLMALALAAARDPAPPATRA